MRRDEMLAASRNHRQGFFSKERMRNLRMRFEGNSVPLAAGGALQIITTQDPETPKGTPNRRTVHIIHVHPDGHVDDAHDEWIADVDHARKLIKQVQVKMNQHTTSNAATTGRIP